jgi:hypothetical protein
MMMAVGQDAYDVKEFDADETVEGCAGVAVGDVTVESVVVGLVVAEKALEGAVDWAYAVAVVGEKRCKIAVAAAEIAVDYVDCS